MATPHISAEKGDFAGTVLMPGDPLRARWIAKTYLKDPKLVTDVRNIFGYTGSYRGGRVSVMASGMGMPSIGIYSYELFCFYDVKNIIRIGSAGAYSADLKLRDILLADAAYSESTYARVQSGDTACWQYPSEKLNGLIGQTAGELDLQLARGPIHSSDVFYHEDMLVRDIDIDVLDDAHDACFGSRVGDVRIADHVDLDGKVDRAGKVRQEVQCAADDSDDDEFLSGIIFCYLCADFGNASPDGLFVIYDVLDSKCICYVAHISSLRSLRRRTASACRQAPGNLSYILS